MPRFTGDLQVLLYTQEETFSDCCAFYRRLLADEPYYTWNNGSRDCGMKFHAGGGTIGVLCQDHEGPCGPSVISLEAADVDQVYRQLQGLAEMEPPVTRPYGTRCFTVLDPCGNRINIYRLAQS